MKKYYKNHDTVPQTGRYRCLACGEILLFFEGKQFSECLRCQAGTAAGPDFFKEDADIWILVRD